MKRLLILVPTIVVALVLSGCSSGASEPETCDELVDETMTLIQDLINSVDDEFNDLSVEEFIATGGDLPSIEAFEEDAERIDELGAELGCTQTEISAAVSSRIGDLTATTELGNFLINAIRAGGL